ncbi:hypothetical protein G6F57_005832 [Rhizopus arrhizus]|nr:hypothetical protein G6F23_008154 [Rhizopus arrhizus]KAG1413198.1 hypothetical protein G6F58_007620 [Rhizopus delemar]KAG0758559.1 hypothetical protein G6F24_009716 [Rhizopus arrhizus]KAG0790267.1 hypothetical protein G6F22_006459 [Rhizopus arrhizus]KAG0790689.1 hypothetical protein G6F21_005622 [Rhizopus arrhizus]
MNKSTERPLKRKANTESGSVARRQKPSPSRPASHRSTSTSSKTANTSSNVKKKISPTTKKIPFWDAKGKMNELQSKLEETGKEVSEFEKLKDDLQTTVHDQETILKEAFQKVTDLETTINSTKERHSSELNSIRQKFNLQNQELVQQNAKYSEKMSHLDQDYEAYQTRYEEIIQVLEEEKGENMTLKATVSKISAAYSDVDADLRTLRMKLESTGNILEQRENEIKRFTDELLEQNTLSKEIERQLIEEETTRRKLHNTIQELKGNIRVFCRVRPLVDNENNMADIRVFGEDSEHMELREQVSSTLGRTSTKTHTFSFDRVFAPECNQSDCYEEISQLVQSALDGYNVCIFAYGQTGSGKTFTMQGPPQPNEETIGMIPRAVHQIYKVTQQLKQFGWEYTMEGQFLEIYNESINDLLGEPSDYSKVKHDIHHDKNGRTTVTGMKTVILDSPSKVKMMLKRASQNRATSATNINERSSRSHSVFTLQLTGENKKTGERSSGLLNLIDLAGSERLSMSGSVGDRLKETQAINKSLSSLGDVIQSLVNKKEGSHVPYRNSKLTWLLRNSLGGNCKTLMFVNVSPLVEHFNETLCSLRFATKVNSCHVGTAKKSIGK